MQAKPLPVRRRGGGETGGLGLSREIACRWTRHKHAPEPSAEPAGACPSAAFYWTLPCPSRTTGGLPHSCKTSRSTTSDRRCIPSVSYLSSWFSLVIRRLSLLVSLLVSLTRCSVCLERTMQRVSRENRNVEHGTASRTSRCCAGALSASKLGKPVEYPRDLMYAYRLIGIVFQCPLLTSKSERARNSHIQTTTSRPSDSPFWSWPFLGPLLLDNESSDARDHCANERSTYKRA